jgi:hypothetical protein
MDGLRGWVAALKGERGGTAAPVTVAAAAAQVDEKRGQALTKREGARGRARSHREADRPVWA